MEAMVVAQPSLPMSDPEGMAVHMRRILCPSDFSVLSGRARDYAIALARSFHAELMALHVFPLVVASTGGVPYFPAGLPVRGVPHAQILEDLRCFLEPAIGPRIPVQIAIREGDPAERIVEHARERCADLIVMGTHGRRGFDKWLLGSVTETVVRQASCPVLTVSRVQHDAGVPGSVSLRKILCAVDLSRISAKTVRYALSLSRKMDGELLLVHILEGFPEGVARQFLKAMVPAQLRGSCQVEETVQGGKPPVEILRLASERAVDLIVMGMHRGNALDRFFWGSTTQRVVRDAVCPVLTICPNTDLAC